MQEITESGVESKTLVVMPNRLKASKTRYGSRTVASSREHSRVSGSSPLAAIKWGQHPLGGAGLIENL